MVKTVIAAGAALALGVLASSANAADLMDVPVTNWSGAYIGAHLGGAWSEADRDCSQDTTGTFACLLNNNLSIDSDGLLGGGQAGYWHQLPNGLTLGIDVQGSFMGVDGEVAIPVGLANSTEFESLMLAQVRVGWAIDRWLPFVQGGYAGSRIEGQYFNGVNPQTDTNWHNGWTVGAGALYMIADNISVGAEYNFVDLSRERYDLTPCSGCVGITRRADTSHQAHVVKATVNFHFGGNAN